MNMNNIDNLNCLTLAYLGDSIYDIYVRKNLINKGITKVKKLQEESIKYVSAKGQSFYVRYMIENNFFNDNEISIINRARNHKSHKAPKNTDVGDYKYATGLEALIGYLYLTKKDERLQEILKYCIN